MTATVATVCVPLIEGLAGIEGVHIVVRHELNPAAMRLMATLGVTVTIDPAGPDCERLHDRDGTRQRCRACARVDRGLRVH